MLVRFKCSQCGTSVKVDSQHAGKKAKCPGCAVPLQIPSLAEIEGAAAHTVPKQDFAATSDNPQFDADDFDFEVEPPQPPPDSENPFQSPTTGYEPVGKSVHYGGFWIRVVAAIIDGFILNIAGLIIGFTIGFIGVSLGLDELLVGLVNYMLSIVIAWLYSALLESSSHQGTLGKMAMGLKVVDLNGRRISFGRATGRHFAKILSSLILMIGFIMVAFTEKKQGLHDLIAGTYVQYK